MAPEGLEQERAKRRKGRPRSTKEVQIEELKIREAEEYKTGSSHILVNLSGSQLTSFSFPILEVPDLVHEINIEMFRGWDQKEGGYLQMLRHIRISGTDPRN